MDCINFRLEGEHLCDLSWSAKTYACSFCQREFRSAQALGGHMNVHRRDRARLRLLPPSCLKPNPNPNPKPNSYFSCSSSSSSSSSSLSSAKCLLLHNHYPSSHSLLSPDSLKTSTICNVPTATAPSSFSSACADGSKKLMMILDSPPPHHQNHVPLIHNPSPKKGMMRSVLGRTVVEAGDLMKGSAQEEDDEFIVNVKKDDENINTVDLGLDLDLDLDMDMGLLKEPCKLDEEVDLELRLGHL